jgi:hypothetical protein
MSLDLPIYELYSNPIDRAALPPAETPTAAPLLLDASNLVS